MLQAYKPFFLCPGNWSLFITVSASLIKDIASPYKPCLSDFKSHKASEFCPAMSISQNFCFKAIVSKML